MSQMSSSTKPTVISTKYKENYLELIVKQKIAASNRCQQQVSKLLINYENEQELQSTTDQIVCKPKKLNADDAIPMNDDDFLLAELNGHFQ